MQIDEIFEVFCNRVAEVELFRKVVKETTQKEIARFRELARADAESPLHEGLSHFMSSQRMSFCDPETAYLEPYGFNESRVEDRLQQLIRHQNRQYGWLLVEAYEEFEDFLRRTYAWLGKHDWRAWRLGEFGNIRYEELQSKPFDWYLDAVKSKFGRDPTAILDRLRDLDPDFASTEARNKCRRNLRLSIELIANLRHKVVHARAQVSDRSGFIEQVLKNSGAWCNGEPKAEDLELVETYLSPDPDDCFVRLLEVPAPLPAAAPPQARRILQPHFDICGSLVSDLVADAVLVCRSVSPPMDPDRDSSETSAHSPHPRAKGIREVITYSIFRGKLFIKQLFRMN